jgi:hypothetical protein
VSGLMVSETRFEHGTFALFNEECLSHGDDLITIRTPSITIFALMDQFPPCLIVFLKVFQVVIVHSVYNSVILVVFVEYPVNFDKKFKN